MIEEYTNLYEMLATVDIDSQFLKEWSEVRDRLTSSIYHSRVDETEPGYSADVKECMIEN